jgi:hypothetical protein
MNPMAKAAIKAAIAPFTYIPGTTCAIIQTASALNIQFKSSRIAASCFC